MTLKVRDPWKHPVQFVLITLFLVAVNYAAKNLLEKKKGISINYLPSMAYLPAVTLCPFTSINGYPIFTKDMEGNMTLLDFYQTVPSLKEDLIDVTMNLLDDFQEK